MDADVRRGAVPRAARSATSSSPPWAGRARRCSASTRGPASWSGAVPVPVAKGAGDVTVLTDQAASDVVLAATRPGSPSTLSVVDPADGTVRLESTLEGPGEVGSVSAIPGQAVVSRVTRDPVRLAEMAEAGGIERPMVTAYSLDDGSPTWTYPRGKRAPLTAAAVLDSDPATGETYVLAVSGPGRAGTASTLVALDADGRVRVEPFLGAGYWDASIADDLLLVQGPASGGGALLRALHREDGSRAWTLVSRDYPAARQALQRFGPADVHRRQPGDDRAGWARGRRPGVRRGRPACARRCASTRCCRSAATCCSRRVPRCSCWTGAG